MLTKGVNTTDYYPFGMPMPGRQTVGGETYRYAFQGQEKDTETGKEAFQLRLWDGRIGRWLTTDPAEQYSSPYLGMGNNPVNGIDPDGAIFEWIPRVNDDGSISYIKEAGDTVKSLQSQFGLSEATAEALYSTLDNGVISGQSVFDMNPYSYDFNSAILKLDLKSDRATSSRVLQHLVFSNDISKSVGDKDWSSLDMFLNVYKMKHTPYIYRCYKN